MTIIDWSEDANGTLFHLRRRYELANDTYEDLIQQASEWAARRIADADAKGYDDDPREVIGSDVGYAWAYMMMCMPKAKNTSTNRS